MGGFLGIGSSKQEQPAVVAPALVIAPSTIGTIEPISGTVQQKRKPVPKSRTIYHETLGQTDTANVATKTLLGQ